MCVDMFTNVEWIQLVQKCNAISHSLDERDLALVLNSESALDKSLRVDESHDADDHEESDGDQLPVARGVACVARPARKASDPRDPSRNVPAMRFFALALAASRHPVTSSFLLCCDRYYQMEHFNGPFIKTDVLQTNS